MGPAVFIMAIFGCGEAEASCRQVAVTQARYESVDACNAQSENALARYQDIEFPVVVAQCQRAGMQVAEQLRADDVKLPGPEQAPVVKPAAYRPGQRIRI